MVALKDDEIRCEPMRHCLACGSGQLVTFLDLGKQPLANDYHDGQELGEFPLGLNVCESCYHSQLTHAVDPDLLFADYAYVSGTSDTLSSYFDAFVDGVEWDAGSKHLSVLDIAGNDGTLLAKFAAHGHDVLNVDPAENLWRVAEDNGVPTLCGYWSSETAKDIDGEFDVVVAMNVVGHVADPLDFLKGCRQVLAQDGCLYIQTSQCEMIERGEFDTCYHEHHSFFTAKSFIQLCRRAGLTPLHVTKEDVHGTSYLWRVGHQGVVGASVRELFDYERTHGYYDDETYANFGKQAEKAATFLYQCVDTYRDGGYAVVGYGAAAKGNTILNMAGVDLDCIVDDNPLKVGLLTPGRNIPIMPTSHLAEIAEPLCIVVLAWNFLPEIKRRVSAVRNRRNDVYVTVFPTPTVEAA